MKRYLKILLFTFVIISLVGVNKVNATCEFNVKRKAMKLYDSFDLKTIMNISGNVTFTSENTTIASVTQDGIVTANAFGQTNINATDGTNTATIILSSGFYNGFDISYYNGTIDWNKVKKEGMDFVMIRSSFGWYSEADRQAGKSYTSQFDSKVGMNMKGAAENNVPFGIYHYSYADTLEEAELEADYVISLLNNYYPQYAAKMSLPVAYDVENANQQAIGKKATTDQIIAFTNKLNAAGYEVMVYANNNFFVNYIDTQRLIDLGYKFWFARYFYTTNLNVKREIGSFGVYPYIYQYTESGSVPGATTSSGATDMNVMYMPDRVKVEVVVDGKVDKSFGVDKGQAYDEELPTYEKEGYNFGGYIDQDRNVVTKDYVYNKNTTLTAVFNTLEFTVEIENDGEIVDTIYPVFYGTKLAEYPVFEKEGYIFNGFVDEEGNVVDENYEYYKDTKITAKYTQIITQNTILDGDDVVKTFEVPYGEKYSDYPEMEKSGYCFNGYEDENGKFVDENYVYKTNTILRPIFEVKDIVDFDIEAEEIELEIGDKTKINVTKVYPEDLLKEYTMTVEYLNGSRIVDIEEDETIIAREVGEAELVVKLRTDVGEAMKNIMVTVKNPPLIYGDVNNDRIVNVEDAALILDMFKGVINPSPAQFYLGDLNNDGVLNVEDAGMILDIYKGLR